MADPTHSSSAIPIAPILQQQRAQIRVELDIAGATMDAICQVDTMVDSIIAETIVITAAELMRSDASSLGQSLIRAQNRLLPNSYRSSEELLSRVTGDIATRSAAEIGFQRLRDLMNGRSRAQIPPPPPAPNATVLALTPPAIRAVFPPSTSHLRRELKTVFLAVVAIILLIILAATAIRSLSLSPQADQQPHPTARQPQQTRP